ncbi:MAG: hypothetical protein HY996_09455 [Micrococcales bacterium]|nr:hypothetical protein [Micrococcales bacterium]
MATRNQKVHGVIHAASATAAAIGGGFAQLPASDAPVLAGLQTAMILGIADLHGATATKAVVSQILLPFAATMAGRTASQALVGWFPGIGNVLNAATAASLTEAIGWAADAYFAEASAKGGGRHEE